MSRRSEQTIVCAIASITGLVTPSLVSCHSGESETERRSEDCDVWPRSGLCSGKTITTIIAGEVTELKQTMQRKIAKILIYSNWIFDSKCVVSGSKNAKVFWHKGSVSLFESESSQKLLEENCIEDRGDSPVSTNTIQRINNGSAKSTTKSEPDKEPPQWPGCDAKSL